MTLDHQKIKSTIVTCIINLNNSLVDTEKISTDCDHILFGEGSFLDSMGLLNLLMDLEEKLEDEGVGITILDDHALSRAHSPFRTISALADYIQEKIQYESR